MSDSEIKSPRKWRLPILLLIAGLVLGAAFTMLMTGSWQQTTAARPQKSVKSTLQARYDAAVQDAVFADKDEVQPLVSLTKADPRVTWNKTGDRVLLLTWHNYPDSYPAGQTVKLEWGKVWTFTEGELAKKYTAEQGKVKDWELRLKELIGFPPDDRHSTVTGMWVRPADIRRPAYQPDPAKGNMRTNFGKDVDPSYKTWFDGNIVGSYFDDAYPWTRLGYTYDWGGTGTEYGLTEFIVNEGAQVEVDFTENTAAFLKRLAKE